MFVQVPPKADTADRMEMDAMFVLVVSAFGDPQKVAPLVKAEIEKVHELQREGVVIGAYRRADGAGVIMILKTDNLQAAQEAASQLPLAKAGLLTFDFAELLPL
jgi:uncharacterized protein YciI